MNTSNRRLPPRPRRAIAAAFLAWAASTAAASAQTYSFIGESSLVDSCPACGKPDIIRPMHGSFELRVLSESPIERRYAVNNLSFATDDGFYHGSGAGTFSIRWVGPAELHHWELTAEIRDETGSTQCLLRETDPGWGRPLPMIRDDLEQTNGTLTRKYLLTFEAAPFTELWFATRNGFTPATSFVYHTGGNLLSHSGRVVRSNDQLTAAFGLKDAERDPGLDGVEILPGGCIAFSLEEDAFTGDGEALHHGDILTDDGRILVSYETLFSKLGVMPVVPDLGTDAFHRLDSGEVLFSTVQDAFSETLGVKLSHGAILSSEGRVVRTNASLLERFHPPADGRDRGLDALWIWPHGEIWFSLEEGFEDAVLGPVLSGDILSDQGYRIVRNLDLMQPFQPLEDLADFGLDALFLVTETAPRQPPRIVVVEPDRTSASLLLEWAGGGRVFQLERAFSLEGPFQPLTPLTTERSHTDTGILEAQREAFYRIRQW